MNQFRVGDRVVANNPQFDGRFGVPAEGIVARTTFEFGRYFVYLEGNNEGFFQNRFKLDTTPIIPTTKRVRLVVTKKDIEAGDQMIARNCPVAKALKRVLKPEYRARARAFFQEVIINEESFMAEKCWHSKVFADPPKTFYCHITLPVKYLK